LLGLGNSVEIFNDREVFSLKVEGRGQRTGDKELRWHLADSERGGSIATSVEGISITSWPNRKFDLVTEYEGISIRDCFSN